MSAVPGTRIINPALTLLGVLTQGETPSTSETSDALLLLNAMWANWNADDLTAALTTAGGTWTANAASDFLGGTSTAFSSYTGPAPARLRHAFITLSGRNIPLHVRNLEWYKNLAFPLITAASMSDIVYSTFTGDSTVGGSVFVYPVPTSGVTISATFTLPFPIAADATTALLPFNQLAVEASIYNLAVVIGAAFGVNVAPQIQKQADDSLARLRNFSASLFSGDPNPPQGQSLPVPAPASP